MQMILSGNEIKLEQVPDLCSGEDLQIGCGLKTGSIVRATVIFASDSSINIKLDNGAMLRATVQGMVTLAEGDEALFFVSQNDGRRIVLTPVDEVSVGWTAPDISNGTADPPQNPTLIKWSPSILTAIERCGCTPTEELASRVAAIMKDYPEVQTETAVFIAAGEMEPTPENIEIGNMLNRSSFKIGQEINQLLNIIFLKIQRDILKDTPRDIPKDIQKNIPGEAEPNRQDIVSDRPEQGAEAKVSSPDAHKSLSPGENHIKPSDQQGEILIPKDTPQVKSEEKTSENYHWQWSNEAKSGLENGRVTPGGLAVTPKYVGKGPSESRKSTLEAVHSITEELFFRVDDSGPGKNLKKTVTELPSRIDALLGIPTGTEDNGGVASGHLFGRVASALKFMNSIPGFAFVQIPLLYQGMPGTADLYVLRRRRHQSGANQGELCAVLALDMKNLGHVEALLRICGRGMTIRVTTDGENQANFLTEHLGELRKPLHQAGYEITEIQVAVSREKTTPIDVAKVFGREERNASGKIDLKI